MQGDHFDKCLRKCEIVWTHVRDWWHWFHNERGKQIKASQQQVYLNWFNFFKYNWKYIIEI